MKIELDKLIQYWADHFGPKIKYWGYDAKAQELYDKETHKHIFKSHNKKMMVSWLKGELIHLPSANIKSPERNVKDMEEKDVQYTMRHDFYETLKPDGTTTNTDLQFEFRHSRKLWSELSTKKTFSCGLNIGISAGFLPFGTAGINLDIKKAIEEGKNRGEGNEAEVKLAGKLTSGHEVSVYASIKSQQFMSKIALSGYIFAEFSERQNRPHSLNTDGKAHHWWLISIEEIFLELQDMLKTFNNKNHGKEIPKELAFLKEFNIDKENKVVEVTFDFLLESCLDYSVKEHLSKDLVTEIAAHFKELQHEYRNNILPQLTLKRFYYPEIPLGSNYIDLTACRKEGPPSSDLSIYMPTTSASEVLVLVTGEAGIGKTTLTKHLLHQWSGQTWAKDYQWVFRIPVGNLTEENYPRGKKEKYVVADIIMKECFKEHKCSSFELLLKKPWFLISDIFQSLITGRMPNHFPPELIARKVLVILDGFDENRFLPGHLNDVFDELINSPHTLVASRGYGLDRIRESRISKNIEEITITGFSDQARDRYIGQYFPSVPNFSPEQLKKNVIDFTGFLNNEQNQEIKKVCAIPIILELMCMAWLDSKRISDGAIPIVIKAALYENVLSSLAARYLSKYRQKVDITDLDAPKTFQSCMAEIAFTEHFAFILTNSMASAYGVSPTLEYLNKDLDQLRLKGGISPDSNLKMSNQRDFGFIVSDSPSASLAAYPDHYFSHITFQHFFCARYLISCLRQELKNNPESSYTFPYQHRWQCPDQIDTVTKYILSKRDLSYEPVWDFIRGILKSYNDEKTLAVFESKLLHLEEDQKFINELALLNYKFTLTRADANTLIIECVSSKDGTMKRIPRLNELQSRLATWLTYKEYDVKLEPDEEKPILKLSCDNEKIINEILSWLIEITNKLQSKPMELQKGRFPSFFTFPSSNNTTQVSTELRRIECNLQ